MHDDNFRLVYSTEQEVPKRKNPVEKNGQTDLHPPARQKITVRLDRKGRKGKSVTIIDGLFLKEDEMASLLKQLKSKLGTGGTVKGRSLEIQGNHCKALISALGKMGYAPKRSGL